ncbi:MAG: hypothetical protein OQL05_02100, partial [Gammaproteobacteria bacterium]|nr:hypothetical protein [Gammaproteobacteria bacterium]
TQRSDFLGARNYSPLFAFAPYPILSPSRKARQEKACFSLRAWRLGERPIGFSRIAADKVAHGRE